MEMQEQGRWCLERAQRFLEKGEFDVALCLLHRTESLYPHARGLPEILAIVHVFQASSPNTHIAAAIDNNTYMACRHCIPPTNWYKVLKVNEDSDVNTIKKRYHQLALLLHPDKNKHGRAEEAFKLVSEAYALLSDESKRANFDLELMKRQCEKCSSTSRLPSETRNNMSSYRESLKERKSHFHGFHFSSGSHLAGWRLEHENVRAFRQMAQEKIDSLAQILEDRRGRWRGEMDKIKSRGRERYFWRCLEKDDCETEQLHSCTRLMNRLGENDSDACFLSENRRKALLAKGVRRLSLSEKIQSWKSGEDQNPELRQRLDWLLGILNENIGLSSCSSSHTQRSDDKLFGVVRESKVSGIVNEKDKEFVYRDCNTSDDACLFGQLDDDVYTVIDDFLARLDSFPDNYRMRAGAPDLNFRNAYRTNYKSSARNDSAMPYTWTARNCSELEDLRKPFSHDRDTVARPAHDTGVEALRKFSSHDTVTTIFSNNRRRSHNESDIEPKDNMCAYMEASNACRSNVYKERNILQNQKKKSEQLLRTLERLRKETQLVADALESMKEHVTAESHKMSGTVTYGNCIIAT